MGWGGRPTEPRVGVGGGRRPLHPGNRRDPSPARPARRRPERGQQSRAAQLRSGPQDPRVGNSTAGCTGRNRAQRAENPRSPCGVPAVTAVRDGPGAGDARGREVCALGALEAKAAGYTSLACTGGRASVEKLSAPLSLQLRVRCLEIAERKIPKSRKKHALPQPSRCTCAPVPAL